MLLERLEDPFADAVQGALGQRERHEHRPDGEGAERRHQRAAALIAPLAPIDVAGYPLAGEHGEGAPADGTYA